MGTKAYGPSGPVPWKMTLPSAPDGKDSPGGAECHCMITALGAPYRTAVGSKAYVPSGPVPWR